MKDGITITQLLISLVGALGLREMAPILFTAIFRRKEDVESIKNANTAHLQQASREQIVFLKESLKEAYAEVDKMQDMLNDKRAMINDLSKRLYKIELDFQLMRQRMENTTCTDEKCPYRKTNITKKEENEINIA
ncbi:MAG: hypothetical protein PHD21_05690 [Flavobacteriales bacterium]|nr:hypothetical protein [Flavobacteriales bacterium]